LNGAWTKHVIPWAMLSHEFQGGTPFAPDQLLIMQFEAPPDSAFDFSLDDVSFY
jgi:hypothetical protein